jgi:pimeloyl-ACP methyl ester carboxylesterase
MRYELCGFAALAGVVLLGGVAAAEPLKGYHPEVAVEQATRLDWIFALGNQSREEPPADWLVDYDSAAQRYQLFVPPNLNPRKPAPLVLFISPVDQPVGWEQWRSVCEKSGVVFACPLAAGNDCPTPRRVRIVLDVLDNIRRRQTIDPDRTYLAGFSGGARIACAVAFALPEYFGGVVPICGSERLRSESWLRQRVVDRLSVALVTGDDDFNRGELERYRGPLLKEVGVRTKVWTVSKLGHGIPAGDQLSAVFSWLDDAVADRRRLAKQWPAMRIAGNAAPSRTEWAEALFNEAQKRLKKPATLFSGLMLLQGINVRWHDLPPAEKARDLLADYDARSERVWEEDDLAEQRRYLIAEARATAAYASGPLPPQYEPQRVEMARAALELWKQILADGPDTPAGKEAKEHIDELEKIADSGK